MYMIHTCPKRKWYVDRFLIPSMIKEGISKDEILVYEDTNGDGNLKSCLNSFRLISLRDETDTWHLQDDIIISSNFKRVTYRFDRYVPEKIMCGMCMSIDEDRAKPIGVVSTDNLWYSFQCIRIPNKIAGEFVDWLEANSKLYDAFIRGNKYDDSLFKIFLSKEYSDLGGINIYPNIVEHIDYLLGGSLLNPDFPSERKSEYFLEQFLVTDLEQNLKSRNLIMKMQEQIKGLTHDSKRNTNFSRFIRHSDRFTEPDNYNGSE